MGDRFSPADQQLLDDAVASDVYHDCDEALDEAVKLLRRRVRLVEDVKRGIERIARGETVTFDLSEMKAALQRHLQARWSRRLVMPLVSLSRDARQDLLDIAAYIVQESGSEQRGDAFIDAVFATCETLAS